MQSPVQLKAIFEEYIAANSFNQEPKELYAPINYIFSLGGKRLRPLFLLMSCNLFTDKLEEALPAAFAIEIFHNFSLLHDDIMDEASLRRGKASVHIKYDTNSAILSGDVMLIYAYQYLSQLSNLSSYAMVIKLFNQLAIDVCEGQQYDMNFEQKTSVALDAYLKMIELKTAALIGGALGIGGLIGGAEKKDVAHLVNFGRNIGIAFQIQDDILDSFGDSEKFGKKTGGDIAQNKKTFLFLKALEQANKEKRDQLIHFYSLKIEDNSHKIKEVKEIFKSLKVDAIAEETKEYFLDKALKSLDLIDIKDHRKNYLREIANNLMKRQL